MVRHGTRFWWLAFSALLLVVASSVDAKKAATPAPAPSPPPKAGHSHGAGAPQGEAKASPGKEAEPVIEEVTAKQLERVLNEKDFVAVFWYARSCLTCDKVLAELEQIDDDTDTFGVDFVKINDKRLAKHYGIKNFPALTYFRDKKPIIYEGDLMDEENVLDFLTSLEAMDLPDRIEEVNARILGKIIEDTEFVAVLFYDKDQKKSQKVLTELENIDDECDNNNIAFVKIDNKKEALEYGIETMPCLVYFERRIPHIYEGDLLREDELLSWLIHQKRHSEIPEVTDEIMEKLIETVPYLAVLFYDKDDKQDIRVLNELENIDDDLDKEDIVIVRLDNQAEAKELGIDHLPALVYFEDKIPCIYEGELLNEDEVLQWLIEQKKSATIEEVTDEILQDLIDEHEYVVVYFSGRCEKGEECNNVLEELENIDDELDESGIIFVSTEDVIIAKKHGIRNYPALAFFRNKEPLIYRGDLEDEDEVLAWLNDDDTLQIPGRIEEVNVKMLEKLLDENENVVVFFYKEGDKKSAKILSELENIDDECEEKDISFLKVSDEGIEQEYDLPALPALVFYKNRFRKIYTGDLMHEEEILKWVLDLHESTPDVIESVDRKTLQVLINGVEHLAVYFYQDEDKCPTCAKVLEELETIDDDTDEHGIQFVKSKDSKLAQELGIFSFPALVYYETGVPIMFDGSLTDESSVLDWMINQKTDESIDEIDRETLFEYIETKEFLAVVWYVDNEPKVPRVLRHIELIDDEAAEYGIKVVKCKDRLMAKKYGYRNPPGITYFRKGKYINYDGDIEDDEELLDWLTNPDNMEMTDHIERVNRKMFQKIRQNTDYVAVFFYSDDCKQCDRVLEEIEHIDDEADSAGIDFVKIDDKQLAKELGVFALPAILFFKMGSKEPVIFAGDLYDESELLAWLMTQKDPSGDLIEELEGEDLLKTIQDSESLAVYFWNKTLCDFCNSKVYRKQKAKKEDKESGPLPSSAEGAKEDKQDDCNQCTVILEELENIDDDCDRHGITFVKTQDFPLANTFGVSSFPSLVYFENQIPNVFEGDLEEEEEVLQWLITQRTEDRIELITREMLESMVDETQYLAVYFYKLNCHICDEILEGLEKIDDECDVFGIHMVKIQDPQLAKRYSIKTYPALVYFRNGNPLLYEGDLQNEESVLEWLVDDDNRELADEIEEVNLRMLERLLGESLFLAVFFYDEDCAECDEILEELEMIDGEADLFGIDMVKISDPEAAAKFNIINTPSLVYFRKMIPQIYDGDLLDEAKIFTWLTSQDIFEIKNEIEEVNRKMLDKLLDENEYLAVYFYEMESEDAEKVLEKLEKIDGETDNMDVTFVKMADPRYARKWGVTKLPAIVFFRNRFPSIYRGEFESEEVVLEWLRKNRFRQPELNLFMYALIAITLAFVLYTVFLIYGFQQQQQAQQQQQQHHQKQA
ncbi:uncharacterized protein [Bemisia tabaci]|uniref:uncharacterized protein isoform X8 n=1 Tax=Bemisia tabaci TaxID=7038 RepID=UPI003B28B94E